MLNQKIIIVTGGSGLLGRQMIKDINKNNGIAINADINHKTNLDENKVFFDVTNEDSIKKAYELINEKYGRIDGLVNNAYPRTSDWGTSFEQLSKASWSENVDLQLNSIFSCVQLIIPHLEKTQGSIINIGSIYGVVGNDFTIYENTKINPPVQYAAIKGGVINLSRYLASFYGSKNININTVSPGGIFDHQDPVFVEKYEKKVPMKRMGKPEDIAPTISFLCSDGASYITGQNIIVDGGWTCI